jgi:hypothetical protein
LVENEYSMGAKFSDCQIGGMYPYINPVGFCDKNILIEHLAMLITSLPGNDRLSKQNGAAVIP